MQKFSIAIHGGAGTIEKENMTEALEAAYTNGLSEALHRGYAVLQSGGSSTDAVMQAVISLEDNLLFNAGKGSVFTNDCLHEMDASIMNGSNLAAGAVAGISGVRNPIILAYEVMMHSNHVMLSGKGAEEFAASRNMVFENDDYFFSQFRYDQLQSVIHSDAFILDHSSAKEKKFGTVGAVACDMKGNLAAATSTGGMTNKKFGRIGDTPIIGSGTYANNKTCAISCTGHGEIFLRAVAAYDISCLMEYKGMSLYDAMHKVVNEKLVQMGGEGGIIGVDANAATVMLMNSPGMYRAAKNNTGEEFIAIYR
ncbi:MAG TPA: isoaspartyl peptidase/L-asparaginase [Chitinophagaceae bacterium]|nr:isoaspartyl peptidase/L-asparaginase [Chitinophagaceae bacterium]